MPPPHRLPSPRLGRLRSQPPSTQPARPPLASTTAPRCLCASSDRWRIATPSSRLADRRVQPFPRCLASPPAEDGLGLDFALLKAKQEALAWSLRNPTHAKGLAPPPPLPPHKTMRLLVSQAIEVLWPADTAWYKAIVEAYDDTTGMHFLVYADGDVEWLPLHSGYFAWQLLKEGDPKRELKTAIEQSNNSRLRQSLPGRPLAMTAQGARLYGPPSQCGHCHEALYQTGRPAWMLPLCTLLPSGMLVRAGLGANPGNGRRSGRSMGL